MANLPDAVASIGGHPIDMDRLNIALDGKQLRFDHTGIKAALIRFLPMWSPMAPPLRDMARLSISAPQPTPWPASTHRRDADASSAIAHGHDEVVRFECSAESRQQ